MSPSMRCVALVALVALACLGVDASLVRRARTGAGAAASALQPAAEAPCTFAGAMGRCQQVGTCTGTVYSGLCPGARSVQCCIAKSAARAVQREQAANAHLPKITQTTLQRLSETEHRAKWARFKQLHSKVYRTAAEESAAYAVFRSNRVKIIYLNDRFGAGRAMFSSTSPLAATPEQNYQARLGARPAEAASGAAGSLLEVFEGAELDADVAARSLTPAHFQDEQWQAFLQLAAWAETQPQEQLDAQAESAAESDAGADESLVETGGVQACTTWGNEVGLCRPVQPGACRTGKDVSVVSSICPFGSRCCIGDRDDGFQPAAPAPQPLQPIQPNNGNGVVSPRGQPPSTARVTGTMIVDYRPFMQQPTDQGECGSCWTYSAIGTVEGVAAKSGIKIPAGGLSRQWLLECDANPKHQKCRGGFPRYAMEWMQTHTPATAQSYPYTGMPQTCRQQNGLGGVRVAQTGLAVECVRTLTDRECNNSDQAGMLAALKKYGPLSVVLDASNWAFYQGGIYKGTACRNHWGAGNHAVVVVGYGHENGKYFWLIQNSFGTKWGEQGYIRLEAHNGHACGAANQVVYATVVKA